MERLRQIALSCVLVSVFFFVSGGAVWAESATLNEPTVTPAEELSVGGGIVPAGRDGDYSPDGYGTCEVVELANNVIQLLFGLAALFAVIVFVYAGFLMVSSRGDVGQVQKAKGMFTNVIIGFVIMLAAFLIVNTVLGMLLGEDSKALNWQKLECSYSYDAGEASYEIDLKQYEAKGWKFVGGDTAGIPTGGYGGAGGNCSVVADRKNYCYTGNLGCFGDTVSASKVCNLESSGGYVKAVSGTDLCKDGSSFSGGLFQINVLANYDKIPGCSNTFFTKNGKGLQGTCLSDKTNSKGTSYCAVRDCKITDQSMYNLCMGKIMDPVTNIQIACNLYANGGWDHWLTSARACNVI